MAMWELIYAVTGQTGQSPQVNLSSQRESRLRNLLCSHRQKTSCCLDTVIVFTAVARVIERNWGLCDIPCRGFTSKGPRRVHKHFMFIFIHHLYMSTYLQRQNQISYIKKLMFWSMWMWGFTYCVSADRHWLHVHLLFSFLSELSVFTLNRRYNSRLTPQFAIFVFFTWHNIS